MNNCGCGPCTEQKLKDELAKHLKQIQDLNRNLENAINTIGKKDDLIVKLERERSSHED